MERKMFFRLGLGVVLLAAISLSCQMVNNVSEYRSVATNVQGVATDINLGGLATNVQGIATQADVQVLTTDIDLGSLTTQVSGILTGTMDVDIGGLITDIPFLGDSGPVSTPNGFPADVPVITQDASDMTGSVASLEYTVDTDVKDVVDFYRREMAVRGWVEASGSKVTDEDATLTFTLGNRTARVEVEEDFIMGTLVKITLQP